MCTREEMTKIVRTELAKHEATKFDNHLEMMEKFEQTMVMVRDSVPPSLSKILTEIKEKLASNGEKLSALEEKITPAIEVIDVSKKVKKGIIWLSGLLLAIYGIIESITHIRSSIK